MNAVMIFYEIIKSRPNACKQEITASKRDSHSLFQSRYFAIIGSFMIRNFEILVLTMTVVVLTSTVFSPVVSFFVHSFPSHDWLVVVPAVNSYVWCVSNAR